MAQRFFSPSTCGFYLDVVHKAMPGDAVSISEDLFLSLLGKEIEPGPGGIPRVKVPAALNADQVRAAIKQAVTEKRYEVECGGIVLPNGIRLDTAREDQAAIANTIAVMPLTGLTSISFKAASGFVSLTFEELMHVAGAVGLHKQACYNAERLHHVALDARSTIDYLREYDYSTGWPPNA